MRFTPSLLAPLVLVALFASTGPPAGPPSIVGTWQTDSIWAEGFEPTGYVPPGGVLEFTFGAEGDAQIGVVAEGQVIPAQEYRYRVDGDTLRFEGERDPAHVTLRGDSLWLVVEVWEEAGFAPRPVPEDGARVRLGTLHFRLLRVLGAP